MSFIKELNAQLARLDSTIAQFKSEPKPAPPVMGAQRYTSYSRSYAKDLIGQMMIEIKRSLTFIEDSCGRAKSREDKEQLAKAIETVSDALRGLANEVRVEDSGF